MEFKTWLGAKKKSDVWKIKKDALLELWKSQSPESPIVVNPVLKDHIGSTYGEDTIRITGKPEFISSILGRIKFLLEYESEENRLVASYRETQSPSQLELGNIKKSYVFYAYIKQRK